MFNRFKKDNSAVKQSAAEPTVGALYIMTFTPERMSPDILKSVVLIAERMLKEKNPAFARLRTEEMQPETRIEVANIKYGGPLMHTPQTMQMTLAGWIKKQYGVDYKPKAGVNFFPHGMRDPQGKENFFLFYFDMAARQLDQPGTVKRTQP